MRTTAFSIALLLVTNPILGAPSDRDAARRMLQQVVAPETSLSVVPDPAAREPLPAGTSELILDGGFEDGTYPSGPVGYSGTSGPWTWSNTVGFNPVYYNDGQSIPAHRGSWNAYLSGLGATSTATLYQQVAIPAGATATLSFYLLVGTLELYPGTHDRLQVQLLDTNGSVLTTLATYWDRDHESGLPWRLRTFDVSAYAGKTVRVYFKNTEDISRGTVFFVDDVSLTATTGGGGTACGDALTLCLNNNRFKVTASYEDYAHNKADAHAVPLTPDTGYFWFLNSANVEVFVKVLNFCYVDEVYGIYAAGATDLGVTLKVTDTTKGISKTFTNSLGRDFTLIKDGSFRCQ